VEKWTLMMGDSVLGMLTPDDPDWPWLYCHFTPTPAFEPVRPLFVAELEILEGQWDEGRWEKAYAAIASLKLRLLGDDGQIIDEFLLHIDGDTAWFRY
jgi:hypothetical protein